MVDPAGAELAAKLHQLERHVDAAYAASGELAAAIVRAKSAHKLSAVVGHSIVAAVDEASSALVSARGHTVRGHRLLEQLAKSLNIPHAYGDDQKDQSGHKAFTGG